MKNNIWFKLGGAALLGLMILGFAVPSAQSATMVTLTAVYQGQHCDDMGHVYVTLTATLNPPAQNVRFQWDFDEDGIFDTPLSPNPTVTHSYAYRLGQCHTPVVRAVKGGHSATASVTFCILPCLF